MSFGQFLAILRARFGVVVVIFALTVASTLVVSLLLPKQYKATASAVIDFKPDPVSALMFGGMASPAFMATQVDIIQSERVAQRVVRNLKLGESPQIRAQWQEETQSVGNIETWLGTVFQRQLEVLPSRESSVISVSYRAPDSRFAAALANAFVQAYIDTSLDLRVDSARRYAAFFEKRSKEARDALEAAQNRLSTYQKDKGIIASDERLDIENGRLNELSTQLTALQAIAAESASRQTQAQGSQGDRLAEVLNSPVVASLRGDIARQEARLQELSTRLGEAHPAVLEAKANLNEMRSRLTIEARNVTGSVGINNTINRQRESDLRNALEAQRSKVLRLKAVRDEGLVIMRDVDNAQRAYDVVLQRHTQTSLESQATQSNINLLTQAEPPLYAATPRVGLNTLVAAIAGLLLAVGVVLVLELLDRRLRSGDDIVTALGLPVIGLMPKPDSKPARGNTRLSLMQQRLLAPLPPLDKRA
jgi:chain length determinant protein EpsF